MDEVRANGDLGILSKDLVLQEEDLVRHGEQRNDLRIESGQTGHRCGGCAPAWSLAIYSRQHRPRWLEFSTIET